MVMVVDLPGHAWPPRSRGRNADVIEPVGDLHPLVRDAQPFVDLARTIEQATLALGKCVSSPRPRARVRGCARATGG
jgi:hypothetical protein